jgi:hypothetical protein
VELKLEQLQPIVPREFGQFGPTEPPENEQVKPDRASVTRLLGGRQSYRVNLSKLRAAVGASPRTARERRARAAYQEYQETGRWPWQRGDSSDSSHT